MQGLCTTHGLVEARETHYGDSLVLHCACNLQCTPVEEPEKPAPLGEGLEPTELTALIEEHASDGGWYDFDGIK